MGCRGFRVYPKAFPAEKTAILGGDINTCLRGPDDGVGNESTPPPRNPTAQAKIHVVAIHEKLLVKDPDLIEHGASLDLKNNEGETAFTAASSNNHPETVKVMEEAAKVAAEKAAARAAAVKKIEDERRALAERQQRLKNSAPKFKLGGKP